MSVFDSLGIQDSPGVHDTAEFADNLDARCSIVLILDVSMSMQGTTIETVNNALVKFGEIIRADPDTALRADVAIIEFDHETRVVMDFTNGADFQPPTLSAKGGTKYSDAVNLALDMTEAHNQSCRDAGVAYYRSLIYFLTDGNAEHDDLTALAQAATRLKEAEENRSIAFFSFWISHPNYPIDMSDLRKLSPREPRELNNMAQLEGSIVWLSKSVSSISQFQVGDSIRLPEPD